MSVPLPFLVFFLGNKQGKTYLKKGFRIPTEPLKSQRRGKHITKEKQGKTKERKDRDQVKMGW